MKEAQNHFCSSAETSGRPHFSVSNESAVFGGQGFCLMSFTYQSFNTPHSRTPSLVPMRLREKAARGQLSGHGRDHFRRSCIASKPSPDISKIYREWKVKDVVAPSVIRETLSITVKRSNGAQAKRLRRETGTVTCIPTISPSKLSEL